MSQELDQLYQSIILDHSRRRLGESSQDVAQAGPSQGVSHQFNPTCGDEITMRVTLEGTGPSAVVRSVEWNGEGCSISMAAASVLSDMAPGLTVPQLEELVGTFRDLLRSRGTVEPDEEVLGDAAAFAGVSKFVARVKCAMLGWVAAEEATQQAQDGLTGS